MRRKWSWSEELDALVGKRVSEVRRSRGKSATQHAIAKATAGAVSRSSIANIEKGRQGMSVFQLYALARALDVEATELLPSSSEVFTSDEQVPGVEKLSSERQQQFARNVFRSTSAKGKGDSK